MRRVVVFALSALFVFGLARAARLRWVCDDSFISFRYADNLVRGNGLVFNAGERVEGYTNLLWTLAIAGAMKAGLSDPLPVSEALGILSYAGLVALVALRSWNRAREDGRAFLPLAAGVLLVMGDVHVWATGGLETMTFTLLAVAALILTRAQQPSPARLLLAGAVFGALVLTRPDGVLFVACGVGSVALSGGGLTRETRRRAALLLAPVTAVVLALLAFKLSYYGEWLPTSFYSKSAASPYWGQGGLYVSLFIAKNAFLAAFLLGVGALGARGFRRSLTPERREDILVFLGAAALFTAWVMHSGGDFMFARRLIPVVPLALIAAEDFVSGLAPGRVGLAAAALAIAAATRPFEVFGDGTPRIGGIADEPRFYPPAVVEARRLQGEMAGRALEGTSVRALFGGGMCVFAYYSRLPYLVEMTGLTQYSLARRPLAARGHVGHEKTPDAAWLTENHIHLIFEQAFPPIPSSERLSRENEIVFGDLLKATVWIWSDEVMNHLATRSDVYFRRRRAPEVSNSAGQ